MLHMSQKNYKISIIGSLLKKENHIRGLAKELNTNQTTIARKIKELYKNNIVDYNQQGKNKVFFIKKTLEAKYYSYIVEIHKCIEAVRKHPRLRRIFREINQNKKIELAILFGSYAKGLEKKDSDIDLYIETEDRKLKKQVEMIDTKLNVKIGEYNSKNLLIKEIKKNHIIIKGVEHYYEKEKIFD